MSLSHHLLEPGDHGRLGFHPRCAVCRRERLAGVLAARPVVPRCVQAALAAGLLAFSAAGGPIAALAAEPDNDQEGVVPPDASGPGDPGRDPDDDPGGDDTDTPGEDGDPPASPGGDDDAGPVAQPPALVLEPRPVEEPVPPPAPSATPGAQSAPHAQTSPELSGSPEAAPKSARPERPAKAKQRRRTASRGARQVVRTPPAAPAAAPPAQAAAPTGSHEGTGPAAPAKLPADARTYVVKSGDSLWSIARGLLGAEASAAQIAGEVNRLWRLNADRIGTGDPDLIMAGQTLRVR